MRLPDATIVIPVHNQLHYTRQCLESLNASGCPDTMIVVINNASTDDTAQFLAQRPELRVIHNPENRACAAAWNQGLKASSTRWIVFLNNDVVVAPDWLHNLIEFAENNNVDIVTPAMGEGELNHDFTRYAQDVVVKMKSVRRRGDAHGACFVVSSKVFESIGNFDENFRKGGHEDTDFFWRAKAAGFELATTGCTYIHHFSGSTLRMIVAAHGSHHKEDAAYFRRKWKLKWHHRRLLQIHRKTLGAWRVFRERLLYGHTLRERWRAGKMSYH